MKRPLAVLAAAAVTGVALVVPVTAAHADESGLDVTNVTATWKDSSLSVSYDWNNWEGNSSLEVLVDGTSVKHTDADWLGVGSVSTKVARTAASGPAQVSVTEHVCGYDSDAPDYTSTTCTDSTVWSATVRQLKTPPKGNSSASALLAKLKVKSESHSGSYKRSKFELWVDANGDHEDTRAEVLKAESKKKVTENSRHTVKTGKWVSAYDGKTFTVASKLDIDHLVPLQEAWTSGAYAWSAKKREAYANDLGYGASLIAVSKHANRSKGDKEPNAYLPALKSYRCAYVRNFIAVKSRWSLSVDSTEKTALSADLATYCTSNDWVKTPGKPNIKALVPKPKPTSGGGSGGSGGGGGGTTHGLDPRYPTCTELLKHPNHAPYQRGVDPEYNWYQDRDGDGLVCE